MWRPNSGYFIYRLRSFDWHAGYITSFSTLLPCNLPEARWARNLWGSVPCDTEQSKGREKKGPKDWHNLLGHVPTGIVFRDYWCRLSHCEVEGWWIIWLTGYPGVKNKQLHPGWDAGSKMLRCFHYLSWQNTSTTWEDNHSFPLLWMSKPIRSLSE